MLIQSRTKGQGGSSGQLQQWEGLKSPQGRAWRSGGESSAQKASLMLETNR